MMSSGKPFEVPFIDSFLTDEEFIFLREHAAKIKQFATEFHKSCPLIIAATEEYSKDYLVHDNILQNIFEKISKKLHSFDWLPPIKSVEHWYIFSNLNHKKSITSTHGPHFDDNKWTVRENANISPPALIAIFYLHSTPTSLRVFNYDYENKDKQFPHPLKFIDVECKQNRLIIFQGNKYHGVIGKFKDDLDYERAGLVFNLWEESPQRPWWI